MATVTLDQTLEQLNDGFIRSVRTSDVRWFDEHLADDFLNTNPDGALIGRAAFLEQIARPCPVAKFAAEDIRIRVMGDTAIIHGRTTYETNGRPAAGQYTDVWMRRQGRWLCEAAHVTRG